MRRVAIERWGLVFQSAPPAETRGDPHLPYTSTPPCAFQSAPPAETRGDRPKRSTYPALCAFQSAPPAETRGDRYVRRIAGRLARFNPLPPPKRGETLTVASSEGLSSSFNPLPPPKRGETHTGRHGSVGTGCFNPLPPPKRGETQRIKCPVAYVVVSIRSPRRNEGRLTWSAAGSGYKVVSIRSPRRNEGRLGHWIRLPIMLTSFNPLPPPKRGETRIRNNNLLRCMVSIRSPRRNEGRHTRTSTILPLVVFQSAPPAETRGDRPQYTYPAPYLCFNPLPPPKRGETVGAEDL